MEQSDRAVRITRIGVSQQGPKKFLGPFDSFLGLPGA